jgi:hypothetical protein
LTPNKRKGELSDFEALEAFVLVSRNRARGREGAALNWVDLNKALLAQRAAADGQSSPMRKAVDGAVGDDGLIKRWTARADSYIDPHTDLETYRNPAYRDLAEYAERYFRSAVW